MIVSNESKFIEEDSHTWGHYYLDTKSIGTIEDDYMSVTSCSDHDWENETTFDIENLWGTNSENDDVNNVYTISTIHVPYNDDMESSKLGDEVFENPFATDDYIIKTSPSSKINEDMFTNEHTLEDNYSIAYDDTMPPVFDNYKEYYDIG